MSLSQRAEASNSNSHNPLGGGGGDRQEDEERELSDWWPAELMVLRCLGGWLAPPQPPLECLVVRIVALSIALFGCASARHRQEVPKRRSGQPGQKKSCQAHFHGNFRNCNMQPTICLSASVCVCVCFTAFN